MYAAESVVLRVSIVLGMVAAVMTVLYFSPMPDQFYRSCDRPCSDVDWPMICRFKITVEAYKLSSRDDCLLSNYTSCENATENSMRVNNLLTGPSIQVCENDVLVVDIINKLPGNGMTIHWRGQMQKETPFMDGTPMITQCPINSYTTFQYKFRAAVAGTHLWHAHAVSDKADGIFGALVVRRSTKLDHQRKLYDFDEKKHLLVVSEANGRWFVNGKDAEIYEVHRSKRYRFRVGYGGGNGACPVRLSIEEHTLKVISLDGIAINTYEASSIVLTKGERVDFVLKANKDVGDYNVKLQSECDDNVTDGIAVLRYLQSSNHVNKKSMEDSSGVREFTTAVCDSKLGKVCLGDVQAYKKLPKALKEDVIRKIYLQYDFKVIESSRDANKIYRMNNITFTYPPSPLLTQFADVPREFVCNSLEMPARCKNQEVCECVHIEQLRLGSTVELVLIDQGGDDVESIFHLHGYRFFVVAAKLFDELPTLDQIKSLDTKGHLFKRNLISPAEKDTIRIPRNGIVAIRFVADNPGYWMLRDGKANQWTRGMDLVFQVGKTEDLPAKPKSFPTCGSWVGPDFYLT